MLFSFISTLFSKVKDSVVEIGTVGNVINPKITIDGPPLVYGGGEAERRYYSAKQFSITGIPTVFSPLIPYLDTRYFDFQNIWYHFDSEPLKRSLERFAKFPIATNIDEKSSLPRLILMSVDVPEGAAVAFDSYETKDGSRKSEYGKYITEDGKGLGPYHMDNDGIRKLQ